MRECATDVIEWPSRVSACARGVGKERIAGGRAQETNERGSSSKRRPHHDVAGKYSRKRTRIEHVLTRGASGAGIGRSAALDSSIINSSSLFPSFLLHQSPSLLEMMTRNGAWSSMGLVAHLPCYLLFIFLLAGLVLAHPLAMIPLPPDTFQPQQQRMVVPPSPPKNQTVASVTTTLIPCGRAVVSCLSFRPELMATPIKCGRMTNVPVCKRVTEGEERRADEGESGCSVLCQEEEMSR